MTQMPDDLLVEASELALERQSSDVFSTAAFRPLAILLPTEIEQVSPI